MKQILLLIYITVPNNNDEYEKTDSESFQVPKWFISVIFLHFPLKIIFSFLFQWIFSFVFAIAIFLLMVSMVYMFRRVVKRMRKINSIQNWRGVYHNVPSGGG